MTTCRADDPAVRAALREALRDPATVQADMARLGEYFAGLAARRNPYLPRETR